MHTLKVISGPAQGQTLEIDRELVLGREDADLTIADPEMSRRQLAVRPVDRGVEVEDLGSTNGTFVNGQRISAPVTLSVSGKVKAGHSEIVVEIAAPQVTRAAHQVSDSAAPNVTRASDIPVPPPTDVTAPRRVPDPPAPDVTAPRQIPDLPAQDVTAPRRAPDPPVPDVTAPRRIPASPAPDVTRARDVAAAPPAPGPAPPRAGGPDVTAPRGAPPAPPAEEVQAQAPTGGPPRKGPPIGLLFGLIAIVLIVVFALAARGEATEERDLSMSGQLSTVRQVQAKQLSSGELTGKPFGKSKVTLDITLGGPTAQILKGETPLSGKIILRSATGSITGTVLGTVTPSRSGNSSKGRVEIGGGTGDYEGAEGSGTFSDKGSDPPKPDDVTIRGKIEY